MVKIIIKNEKHYQCEECGFEYQGKEWAEKCETWCKEHHTCNLEIIEHAIHKDKIENLNE